MVPDSLRVRWSKKEPVERVSLGCLCTQAARKLEESEMNGNARQLTVAFVAVLAVLLGGGELGATGSHGGPLLTIGPAKMVLDGQVDFTADFGRLPGQGAVYFYLSTSSGGTSTVLVEGQTVTLPMPNASLIGTPQLRKGSAQLGYVIPSNQSLIGQSLRVIAVTVLNGVVQSTNLAISGPILGDDIA